MNNQQPIFIFGASTHAKVVIDIIEREKRYLIKGLFDDNQMLWEREIFGYNVIGGIDALKNNEIAILIAIGHNSTRYRLSHTLAQQGSFFAQAIHPFSAISRGVKIGHGTIVMAGVVINADTEVGDHAIINTAATVDHDCFIEEAVHIAPGAHLCGAVFVGKRTLIGAGATVIPNIRIGYDVIIGAGATIVTDVPDNVTVVGTPARIIKEV